MMKIGTRIIFIFALLCCVFISLTAFTGPAFSEPDAKPIYLMTISDAIGPGVADFITSGIKRANDNDAGVLIIQLDTPGGLAESMRTIVKAILASKVPVVVYVSPGGGKSGLRGCYDHNGG